MLLNRPPEVEQFAERVPDRPTLVLGGLARQQAGLAHRPRDGEVAGDDGAAVLPHRRPPPRDRDDRVPGWWQFNGRLVDFGSGFLATV